MYSQDSRVDTVLKRVGALRGDRGNWESHWKEIAELVLPSYSDLFQTGGTSIQSGGGEKKTEKQFDATAPSALTRFSSVMESILTPRQQQWHSLKPADTYLLKDYQTKLWYEEATKTLFRYRYGASSFYASQQHEVYTMLGAFGTGCLFVDKTFDRPGLSYRAYNVGEILFDENHQGMVDSPYREFSLTGRQLLQKFGKKVPKEVFDEYSSGQDKDYDIIHCVHPQNDRDPRRIDYKGMPFESLYICKKTKTILQEGGYKTLPYIISRYVTIPGEKYGRSPAMQVLPAIKTLNEQKKTVLKQGHRTVDPVLLAYDDGVMDSFSMRPGALNYGGVSAEGRLLVQSLPVGNIAIARDMMEDERLTINDAFLVTLFQILVETPQMTATEVLERAREKAALLAPIMGRQQSEALGPMIEREMDLLDQQRLLPPPTPAMLEAGISNYKVEYDSPLSRMQKAEAASGGLRMFQYASEIAANTQNPSPMDFFNLDAMIPDLADAQGMPATWMNNQEKVDQIREERSTQQAQQQMIEAAPSMASMIKATGTR
jgi:hypothetical protein